MSSKPVPRRFISRRDAASQLLLRPAHRRSTTSQPFCVCLRLRLHRRDVCTTRAAPDGAFHTTWQRRVSSLRRQERLVECFRTQPLTPIKEVTIETGQSACDRPNPGAGRRRWQPMAALASIHKVIHSFSGWFSPEATKTAERGDKKVERARPRTPSHHASGLLSNPSRSKRAQSRTAADLRSDDGD